MALVVGQYSFGIFLPHSKASYTLHLSTIKHVKNDQVQRWEYLLYISIWKFYQFINGISPKCILVFSSASFTIRKHYWISSLWQRLIALADRCLLYRNKFDIFSIPKATVRRGHSSKCLKKWNPYPCHRFPWLYVDDLQISWGFQTQSVSNLCNILQQMYLRKFIGER